MTWQKIIIGICAPILALIIIALFRTAVIYIGAIPTVIIFVVGLPILKKLIGKWNVGEDKQEEEVDKNDTNGSDDV